LNPLFDAINEMDERIRLFEIFNNLGLQPKRDDGQKKVYSCPFHSDSTPSFYLTENMNKFHCFGCQRGGGVYKFAKEYLEYTEDRKIGINDVIKWLSQFDKYYSNLKIVLRTDTKINPNKKYETLKRIKEIPAAKLIVPETYEEKKRYISGIMLGYSDDLLEQYMQRKKGNAEDIFKELVNTANDSFYQG
jgi:hypothetical protein